jgi:hypothetical protein
MYHYAKNIQCKYLFNVEKCFRGWITALLELLFLTALRARMKMFTGQFNAII